MAIQIPNLVSLLQLPSADFRDPKYLKCLTIQRPFVHHPLGLERIHQVTNTIHIANIGWRIRICIREYTFFSEAINFIRQCSKFHTVIMLSNFINLPIIEMNEFTIFYQHQL